MKLIDLDPINRDLTLKKRVLTAKYGEYAAEDGSYMSWREIFELVNRQPEVDAVPVVRCKDCKHGKKRKDGVMMCGVFGHTTSEWWYCSQGNPKEGGEQLNIFGQKEVR